MSDDIKELVKKLRAQGKKNYGLYAEVADALEALVKERDRLKAALETIAEGRDSGRHDGLPEEHPAYSAVLMHYIACEALEGREWERLGNEKAGTHGSPELDEDARKLEAMGQDPGATFATDPAPAVCEWASIETAPTDGSFICGAWLHGRRWATRALYWNGLDWECPTSDWLYEPTHWMPLPPPEAKE